MSRPRAETAELWAAPSLGAERRAALLDVWSAFWMSRAAVWIGGIAAIVVFGWFDEHSARLDPLYLTSPFEGGLANLLVAPAARFDAAWYLAISDFGYEVGDRAAFFPLYPGLAALAGLLTGSSLLGAIAVSAMSALGSLYLLHRLVSLDHDPRATRTTILIVAWFPTAFVLSAVYSEGLFMLTSIGSLYAARLGRWPAAGLLGALAAATRSGGVILIVPLLILYLYGPRADRRPPAPGTGWRPRHAPRPDFLWVLALPLGLLGYMAYLGLATGDPLALFSAQQSWSRSFVPLGGIVLGTISALSGLFELLPGLEPIRGAVSPAQLKDALALRDVVLFGFMVGGLWLLREAWRRGLPPAYLAYAACGLALPLSVPAEGHPLQSLPRFEFALFPLWIALALWALERRRVRSVLVVMGTLLVVWSGLFATWSFAP
jgi:hypothetical protein